ncbi:putative ABC transport system permease protein [bacterium A37T11]|nr:putative ABC transport system permease protein [bacterium A37T11]
MIRNYFKTAFRTMVKDKAYAIINILGLTIGLCACMLVINVVIDEQSYDKFWSRSKDLYKMYVIDKMADGIYQKKPFTPDRLGKALKANFPEVEQFSAISVSEKRFRIGLDNPDGIAANVWDADTNALSMFDIKSMDGRLPSFIAGQKNLLITESFRDRYFRDRNPVGQVIDDIPSWSNNKEQYLITGIIKDIRQNTHLRADAIALKKPTDASLDKSGLWGGGWVYYLLKSGTNAEVFTRKMNGWIRHYVNNPEKDLKTFRLQPIADVYLGSDFDTHVTVQGSQTTLYILTGVGALLLFIACVNFVNLSIARAIKRLKETGVRKILGAQRGQLAAQFLAEALLFFLISTVLAIAGYALALPVVENFAGHQLVLSLFSRPDLFGGMLLVVFLVCILTGAYPAWVLSGFKPSLALRGKLFQQSAISAGTLRKLLVIVQFAIAIVVLVSLLVVRNQVNYLEKKDIGYQKENLLHIGLRQWEGRGQVFKNELRKLPGIEDASIAGWSPVDGGITMSQQIDNPLKEGEKVDINFIIADFDFARTMRFKLESGRYLDLAYGTDAYDMNGSFAMDSAQYVQYKNSRSSLITASTAKMLDIKETGVANPKIGYPSVGILRDFNRESLRHALGPIFILGDPNPDYARMFIRTTPGREQQAQQSLRKLWKEFYPNRVLDAEWVTDILDKQYEAEHKQQTLFFFFSGLMLFLSAMGVFGLIVHTAQQRLKEIGIRKVLGASVSGIVALLSKDFVKLVLIAVIVASPVAWWLMNKWLEDFAYRIAMQWWMFAVAGLTAILIALLTVGWQAIWAAVANPVDSLRNE